MESEDVSLLENCEPEGECFDLKQLMARQEQLVRQLLQHQERHSGELLEKMTELRSRQDVAFQQMLEQQQSLERMLQAGPEVKQNGVERSSVLSQPPCHEPSPQVSTEETHRESRDTVTSNHRDTVTSNHRASTVHHHTLGNRLKRHMMKPFEGRDEKGGCSLMRSTTQTSELEERSGLGLSRTVVKSKIFEPVNTVMLLSNAAFIGLQVEYRTQHSQRGLPMAYEIIDYVYTIWFVVELLFRGTAAGFPKFFTDRDARSWNLFDFFIVIVTVLEKMITAAVEDPSGGLVGNLSAFRTVRVCRVVRLARVVRVLHFFRSFRILCSALLSTAKSCLWTSVLLCVILYMFALVFAQAVADYRISIAPSLLTKDLDHYYGSLPRGIFTLFKSMVGGIDWEVATDALSDVGPVYVALFIMMVVFVYLAVMNVMSGLFLQNALEQASSDRDDVIQEQMKRRKHYVNQVVELFREIDHDGTECITLEEFESNLKEESMAGFLQALEIDTSDAWNLFRLLDVDGGGTVSISEFVDGMLRMRGNAKSVHLAQLMFENKWQMEALSELYKFLEHRFLQIEKQLMRAAKAPPLCANSCTATKLASDQEAGAQVIEKEARVTEGEEESFEPFELNLTDASKTIVYTFTAEPDVHQQIHSKPCSATVESELFHDAVETSD